jgi:hypothetical protein
VIFENSTHHRRHALRFRSKSLQIFTNVDVRTVENNIKDCLRGARVVDQLVRKPYALSGWVLEVAGPVLIFVPEETEK